jgi:oligopeptide transport system substrate-binding protein
VLAELKRQYGEAWIDLGTEQDEEGRSFVDSYLDIEPNRLSVGFRSALFERTGGHPLFTVELLRDLQERGDLILDEAGRWVEGSELDWSVLPARVEGVIEERIGRLEEALRETLSIASVEGEDFTAQVVARVQQVGERKLIKRLSRELERKHRLVQAQDEARVGEHYLSHYRFTHLLFQRFLYNDLSAAERRTMHGEVARVLEELYAGETDAITVQLANHYTEAGEADKAIEYLQGAGDKARLVFANKEAIQFYQRALAFQKEMGYDDQAARTLMKLGLTYHSSFDFDRAGKAWEEGLSLWGQASLREPTSPLPSAPHALRMQWDNPSTLDPNEAEEIISAMFIRQIFSGLVEASPDNSVIPDMAQSWEVLEGGTRYLFHLREDARWSDGTPVTSRDFEYSWKRALALGHSNIPEYFYDIKGARAYHQGDLSDPDLVGIRSLDEKTLLVELEQPASYFLHVLAVAASFPVPCHVVERYGEAWTEVGNIVTNGPFRLESWQRNESIVLERYEDYRGQFTGNLNRVEIQFSPFGDIGRMEKYGSDESDVLGVGTFLNELDWLVRRLPGEYIVSSFLSTSCLGFDTSQPPFNDIRVRKAIAMSMDKVGGWKAILSGAHENSLPAMGGFVPPGIPGHSYGISLPHDPQEAKKLLAEAGYPEGRDFPVIEVIHMFQGEEFNKRTERIWSSQWKEILGIESKWEFLEWKSYMKRVQTNQPMMGSLGWVGDYPDPDNFLRLGIPRWTGWQHDAFEALIEKSRRSMDQNERLALLREADKILMEEAPIIPLDYWGDKYLVKPWVRRFSPSWKYIILDPH